MFASVNPMPLSVTLKPRMFPRATFPSVPSEKQRVGSLATSMTIRPLSVCRLASSMAWIELTTASNKGSRPCVAGSRVLRSLPTRLVDIESDTVMGLFMAARSSVKLRSGFDRTPLLSHIFSATAASEGLGNPVARAS